MSGYGATAPLAPGSVVVPLKETGFDVGEGMLNKTSPEELHQLVKVYNKWFAWGYDKMLTVVLFLCMLLAPFVGMAAAMMAVCTQGERALARHWPRVACVRMLSRHCGLAARTALCAPCGKVCRHQ